jgi:hypothetical protein
MKASRSNSMMSCVFQQGTVKRGIALVGSRSENVERHVLVEQELEPVEQFGRAGLLLEAGNVAHFIEHLERAGDERLLDAGEMHVDDRLHRLGPGT